MKPVLLAATILAGTTGLAWADATVLPGAAYLPGRMMDLMPELEEAISMVAVHHEGCLSIDNASFSETYARSNEPAFFVSCETASGNPPFQNVYVRGGKIVGTTP